MEVTTDELFATIGRLQVTKDELARMFEDTKAALSKSDRAAGEALRALETVGFKETADAITAGKPWEDFVEVEVAKAALPKEE